jgi:capsular exopolysaccharide synthesis family protein
MAPDRPFRVLLVTSAGPSEGKTTVASCIAIAMAQAGQRVILVDCDLRRPRIHRVFRKSSSIGVTTVMLDEGGLPAEELLQTDVPNLSVLPAGPIPPNPAEIFHSARFRKLVAQLSERYDRVIIDSPPVLLVTDATVLSTLVDGCVLVVRAFSTDKELARQSLRAMLDVSGKVAGVILNSVDLNRHEYKYYYYYYKRDGYYSYAQTPQSPSGTSPDA